VEAFTVLSGPAAPLMLPDVNTDVISPAHSGKGSMALSAFAPLRYLPDGRDDPSFVLNRERFRAAPILLAAQNFGCGSSRESAVWSLRAIGIRCVIATSFGDIFFGNCFQNGVLPIVLDETVLESLAEEAMDGALLEVDLRASVVRFPGGTTIAFSVDPLRRRQLLEGLDDLDAGLLRRDQIRAFQQRDRAVRPWIYQVRDAGASPTLG
jgi:3-isopropylmalate/(R)-2-methylmalate dehydratase small subunit